MNDLNDLQKLLDETLAHAKKQEAELQRIIKQVDRAVFFVACSLVALIVVIVMQVLRHL